MVRTSSGPLLPTAPPQTLTQNQKNNNKRMPVCYSSNSACWARQVQMIGFPWTSAMAMRRECLLQLQSSVLGQASGCISLVWFGRAQWP
eukprot:1136287-Pelagomonas_calceolata.AAC.1